MKRTLTFALIAAAFASITAVTAVTFAQLGDASAPAKDSRQAAEAPGMAMCTADHPDCNDIAFGEGDGGSTTTCPADAVDVACADTGGGTSRCAADAGPECQAVDSPPPDASDQPSGVAITYDVTVPFTTAVTDDDLKLANDVVIAFDANATFPRAGVLPADGPRPAHIVRTRPVRAALEAKLEGIASVGDVTCAASTAASPPCCKDDEPVSSTPASEPGVNPSQPGSPPEDLPLAQ
jgi:hypothetical protein